MKKLLVLLVLLIAMTSCESRSAIAHRLKQNPIKTLIEITPKPDVEPYIKVISEGVLVNRVGWVGVIEIEGVRYIVNGDGGIFEIKPEDKLGRMKY